MLDFERFRETNLARVKHWHAKGLDEWLPSQWSNAMAGEVGEACNLTKKMDRLWPSDQYKGFGNKLEELRMDALIANAGLEIGDVVIYADLLASRLGLKLEDCVRNSFNQKSDVLEMPERL